MMRTSVLTAFLTTALRNSHKLAEVFWPELIDPTSVCYAQTSSSLSRTRP